MDGAFSSAEEIKNRAKEFQLKWDQKYVCIAGKLDRREKSLSFTENQLESDSVFERLEEELVDFPFPPHLFTKGNISVFNFFSRGKGAVQKIAEKLVPRSSQILFERIFLQQLKGDDIGGLFEG